jgi:D-alanyl-D-alanine carboxypeptidase
VAVAALTGGLLLHDASAPAVPVPGAAPERSGAVAAPEPAPRRAVDAEPSAPVVLGAPDPAADLLTERPAPPALVPQGPAPSLVPPAPAPPPLLDRYSTSDPASPWVVVNKALPVTPAGWAPADLVTVAGHQVRAEVADPLARMLAAAAADGVRLEVRSGFRSADYQARVHADWVARVGQARADEVSARPGYSEHQTGLAVDVGSGSRPGCDFEACFDATDEGRWVAQRAGEFGFVVRYTAADQGVTGYAPEGWHLRYVGVDLVAEMRARGVGTLEELFGLPGGPAYR